MITATTASLISTVLALPEEDRMAIMDALHVSLADPAFDHDDSDENPEEVAEAWKAEIRRRLDDLSSGQVKTIPADLAEQMISGQIPLNY